MQYSFKQIIPTQEDWNRIEAAYDSTCYQSCAWCECLQSYGAEIVVYSVCQKDVIMGYFIGERRRIGIVFIEAPLEGLGTFTQGLVLCEQVTKKERVEIYCQLSQWLFKSRRASYFQVEDWQLRTDSTVWLPEDESWHDELLDEYNICYQVRANLYVDLRQPIDELWANLHYKSCKYSINKAIKNGLKVKVIDDATEIEDFCRVHYSQLVEVCSGKGLKPRKVQSEEHMLRVCKKLFPHRVLMLQVLGKEGVEEEIMSSAIFILDKGESCYWTGASWKRYQKYCPNELMVWEAMKILHEKGCGELNFCGCASYKLKFGTIYGYTPRLCFYRYTWIYEIKTNARIYYQMFRRLVAKFQKKIRK